MSPQTLKLRELKAQALKAGAKGVLLVRGIRDPLVMFEFLDDPKRQREGLELDGKMLLLAVFEETDGEPNGIEN